MNRQFVRIYLGIAIVLLLSIVGVMVMSRHWLNTVRQADFEEETTELIMAIRDELAIGSMQERYLVLNMFSLTHHMPITLESMVLLPLSSEEKKLLRAGQVVTIDVGGKWESYAQAPDGDVIVLGPYAVGEMMRWQDDLKQADGDVTRSGSGLKLDGADYFFLGILVVSFAAIGAVIFFLIRPLERRIYALSDVAEQFGQGDLSSRAMVQKEDAISELAKSFNSMASRIGGLVQGQRDILRAVSHELRTPLARAFFLINSLKKAEAEDQRTQFLFRLQRSLTELNGLVDELLAYARMEGGEVVLELDCVAIGDEFETMIEVAADLREDITVDVTGGDVMVMANARYFNRALTNLVTNAVRHAQHRIWLTAQQKAQTIEVVVEDDGPGIDGASREKIFEPFFRVDESRNSNIGGTGLGLAIVQRIMVLHGGRIEVGDGVAGGAKFTLIFPRQSQDDLANGLPENKPEPSV